MNKRPNEILDAQIEKLLGMLSEVEALESGPTLVREAATDSAPATTAPPIIRLRNWFGIAVAAAAAILLFSTTIVHDNSDDGASGPPKRIAVNVSYTPKIDTTSCCRRDCVTSTPEESCAILAVLHRWSNECQCMVWDLYDWAGGETIARVQAGEPVNVITDVEMPPRQDEVVLFAVARDHNDLPARGQEAAFLDCLLETSDEAERSDAGYASAVETCLPNNVLVVPQRLAAR